jgi:hypothetical protein
VVKHEYAYSRRKIAAVALLVDCGDEIRRPRLVDRGDFLKGCPERLFDTHAGLTPVDFDGSFPTRSDFSRRLFHEILFPRGAVKEATSRQLLMEYSEFPHPNIETTTDCLAGGSCLKKIAAVAEM